MGVLRQVRTPTLNYPACNALQTIHWGRMCAVPRPETKGREKVTTACCTNVPCCRTDCRNNTFFPGIIRDWNECPPEAVQSPSFGLGFLQESTVTRNHFRNCLWCWVTPVIFKVHPSVWCWLTAYIYYHIMQKLKEIPSKAESQALSTKIDWKFITISVNLWFSF